VRKPLTVLPVRNKVTDGWSGFRLAVIIPDGLLPTNALGFSHSLWRIVPFPYIPPEQLAIPTSMSEYPKVSRCHSTWNALRILLQRKNPD
jgi:hypothetical protein